MEHICWVNCFESSRVQGLKWASNHHAARCAVDTKMHFPVELNVKNIKIWLYTFTTWFFIKNLKLWRQINKWWRALYISTLKKKNLSKLQVSAEMGIYDRLSNNFLGSLVTLFSTILWRVTRATDQNDSSLVHWLQELNKCLLISHLKMVCHFLHILINASGKKEVVCRLVTIFSCPIISYSNLKKAIIHRNGFFHVLSVAVDRVFIVKLKCMK